jgi:hypothetical protein
MDDFFHIHLKDYPWICIIFYAYLYHILVKGPVEPLPNELRLSVESILSDLELEQVGTLQALKRIVDGLYTAEGKWDKSHPLLRENLRFLEKDYVKLLFHFEHQHRNLLNMDVRFLFYLAMLKDDYRKYPILQFLIYTGDAKFDSGLPALDPTNSLRPFIIDLTQIDPEIIMTHPELHIRILIIFNHRIDHATKAAFLVKELKALQASGDSERLNYYYSTIIRGTTMQNAPALDLMQAELDQIDDMYEDLEHNPFYVRWTTKGKAEGINLGREEGKVEAAFNLMQNIGTDANEAARLLGMTPEELQALIAYIATQGKTNSNGNGHHE